MILSHARSLLFLPASNARAIAKVRTLGCDMVLFDLEDAVPDDKKGEARDGARTAMAEGGFGERLLALRVNCADTPWYGDDCALARDLPVDYVVLPKAESADDVASVAASTGKPVIAMIESPGAVFASAAIAADPGAAALFVGVNDLRRDLGIPATASRASVSVALQTIVLAARASGKAVFDGVYNKLDDPEGFAAECREGRLLGFDGKTLIHPNQVDTANRLFAPDDAELARARRLIEAATGGAERFEGEMIETMHVDAARALLDRAEQTGA